MITQENLSDLAIILFCLIAEVILIGVETYRLQDINKHLSDNLIEVYLVGLFMRFKPKDMSYDNYIGLMILFIIGHLVTICVPLMLIIVPIMSIENSSPFVAIAIFVPFISSLVKFIIFPLIDYLLIPKAFYLDLEKEKIIFKQFLLPYSLLKRVRKRFAKLGKHSFKDISGIECLLHKKAFQEYVKYLRYCYSINHRIFYKTLADHLELTLESREFFLDSYNMCIKLSLDENEFYIPLTKRSYLDKSRLLKTIDGIKPLICCKILQK